MAKNIEIKCVNSNSDCEVPLGTTLGEIAPVTFNRNKTAYSGRLCESSCKTIGL